VAAIADVAAAAGEPLRLPAVPPGRWWLQIDASGPARHGQWIELAKVGEHAFDIELTDGVRATGRVTGSPPAVGDVWFTHASGRQVHGLVRPDGTFDVCGLSPGAWHGDVRARERSPHGDAAILLASLDDVARLDVRTGDTTLRLDLPTATARFARVRGQLPATAVGSRIELLGAAERRVPIGLAATTVAVDGSFALDPVLPGRWRVCWRQAGTADRIVDVDAVAGREVVATFRD
jgi:hypothetical protein